MKQFSLFIHLMLSVLLFSACGGKSKSSSVIEAEEAISLRYAENLSLSATEDYTIARLRNPWDTTRILHTYVLVDKEKSLPADLPEGTLVPLRYAENLSLSATEDYTIARLRNPWDTTRILHTYVLVDKEKSLPADLPEGTLVRTPLSKAVVYSSVHCGLLNQIGALKSIGGVCDLKYIKLQEVQDGCRTGSITDVGNGMNPDIEKIIDLHPDAIMLSPFENSGGYGRVEKLNIPIIECADYMETSALGRAEWMRFYGLLFGEAQKADSLFAEVEKNYNELKALVAPLSYAPSVISELKNGSAWYVPGGKSTSARIYADAGANYVFADNEHSGSVPLAFETVFDKGQNADFWLIKYNQAIDKTYKELEQDYAPYTGFRAFKERNIYGCNTGKVDFYEDSPFHPDRLLKDLIKIFHPTLLEGYELKYFTKLAE